jgi:diguanylate cyclase (GGDEF)-like protein
LDERTKRPTSTAGLNQRGGQAETGGMVAFAQMPRGARVATCLLALALAAFTAQIAFHVLPQGSGGDEFEKYVSNLVFFGAALLCGWRAAAIRHERLAWSLFAAGLLLWGLGDLYFTLALWNLDEIPAPSPADGGYLALYPLAYAGIVLLFRSRISRLRRNLWVDGLIGALSVAAFAATLLFETVVSSTGGAPLSVATNLAYPLADLLLVAFIVGALATTGWSLSSAWTWLAGGLLVFAVTDALYLYGTAAGSYQGGDLLDAGWPLAALVIAVAAWLPAGGTRRAPTAHWRMIALPLGFGLACLSLLVYDHFERVNWLAVGLAAAAMLAVLARLAVTFADNVRMLITSRTEALTDALTGLGNRRALLLDLDGALSESAAGGAGHVLALFDLDGFKHYNDTFGHPAGDALLARLGGSLGALIGAHGSRAYRIGGDEFCVLCPARDDDALVSEAAFALTERGEGFAIGCSFGSIELPEEAASADTALRVVDQRMYAHKQDGRASAGRQSKDVLRRALIERDPELASHSGQTAALAEAVARRMRVPANEIEAVRLAAELCNVGTVATPDSILRKPGTLDTAETDFVRGHPIVGERILAAAPSLSHVARLVRSSHERADGGGYPDGLRGEEIPLGARIVFACDSYVTMLTERPHAGPSSQAAACAELHRCAGSQFDGRVVAALCDVLDERVSQPGIV